MTPLAAYGSAREISSGKDTPSGHWELAGAPVLFDWHYFPEPVASFPQELLDRIVAQAALPGLLGNCHASGTEILDRLGEEHILLVRPSSIPRPIRCFRSPATSSTLAWSASISYVSWCAPGSMGQISRSGG